MCDSPKASDCSSRPPSVRMRRRRRCPARRGMRLPPTTPCRRGCEPAANAPVGQADRVRPSPSAQSARAVDAATPNTTGAATASPSRSPDHSGGGRRPSGAPVAATRTAPRTAWVSGCTRDGTRGRDQPIPADQSRRKCQRPDSLNLAWRRTNTRARRSASVFSSARRMRSESRRSSRRAGRRRPSRRARSRRSCGRVRRAPTPHWSCRRPPART